MQTRELAICRAIRSRLRGAPFLSSHRVRNDATGRQSDWPDLVSVFGGGPIGGAGFLLAVKRCIGHKIRGYRVAFILRKYRGNLLGGSGLRGRTQALLGTFASFKRNEHSGR